MLFGQGIYGKAIYGPYEAEVAFSAKIRTTSASSTLFNSHSGLVATFDTEASTRLSSIFSFLLSSRLEGVSPTGYIFNPQAGIFAKTEALSHTETDTAHLCGLLSTVEAISQSLHDLVPYYLAESGFDERSTSELFAGPYFVSDNTFGAVIFTDSVLVPVLVEVLSTRLEEGEDTWCILTPAFGLASEVDVISSSQFQTEHLEELLSRVVATSKSLGIPLAQYVLDKKVEAIAFSRLLARLFTPTLEKWDLDGVLATPIALAGTVQYPRLSGTYVVVRTIDGARIASCDLDALRKILDSLEGKVVRE